MEFRVQIINEKSRVTAVPSESRGMFVGRSLMRNQLIVSGEITITGLADEEILALAQGDASVMDSHIESNADQRGSLRFIDCEGHMIQQVPNVDLSNCIVGGVTEMIPYTTVVATV